MGCTVVRAAKIEVSLDTTQQTPKKIHEMVDALLRANGAIECGIMAHFSFTLDKGSDQKVETDPGPELKKLGVISLKKTEVH